MPNAGEKFVTNWGETTRLKSLHPRCRKIRRLESLVRRLFEKIVISFGWLEDSPYFFFFSLLIFYHFLSLQINHLFKCLKMLGEYLSFFSLSITLNITRSLQIVNSWETFLSHFFTTKEGRTAGKIAMPAGWKTRELLLVNGIVERIVTIGLPFPVERGVAMNVMDSTTVRRGPRSLRTRGVANFKAFLAKNGEIFLKKKTIFCSI